MTGRPGGGPALELDLLSDPVAVCRLPAGAPWPVPPPGTALYAVTRTAGEISVVCTEDAAPAGARIEPGWRALRVRGPLDFSLVGVVASLTAPLGAADVAVFVLSTYDTDLVLVRSADAARAAAALRAAGHTVT